MKVSSRLANAGDHMAKKGTTQNGRDRLEEAMALLIQNEAAFVGRLADSDKRFAESDRRFAEMERTSAQRFAETERANAERFARIEKDMAAILRVLAEHGRMLERLPEAVREKIGFKGPSGPDDDGR
ncbi:MAG: hypothetical protein KY476_19755 [Planctomycetes bacterium]|nr:hypothetical protein [Planctomycetota bacterium]